MSIKNQFPEMADYLAPFVDICHVLYDKEFVCAYDGNVSLRFGNAILATPTHLSKGMITEDDLIVVDCKGKQLAGSRKPTSELKVHLSVYRNNPHIQCVIHAHPLYATAIYRNGKKVDTQLLTEAHEALGVVPVVPYHAPGTAELAEAVGHAIGGSVNACIMEKHGVVVSGRTLMDTYFLLTSLERLAKTEHLIANMK